MPNFSRVLRRFSRFPLAFSRRVGLIDASVLEGGRHGQKKMSGCWLVFSGGLAAASVRAGHRSRANSALGGHSGVREDPPFGCRRMRGPANLRRAASDTTFNRASGELISSIWGLGERDNRCESRWHRSFSFASSGSPGWDRGLRFDR